MDGKDSVSAALLLCVFCAISSGQTANATLGGTVSDSTGALIPGVTVTATNGYGNRQYSDHQ
jgi:hypothetical protein